MRLDRRAEPEQIVARELVPEHDGVRVADVDGHDRQSLARHVELLVGDTTASPSS